MWSTFLALAFVAGCADEQTSDGPGADVAVQPGDTTDLERSADHWYLSWMAHCSSPSCGAQIRPLNQAEMYCPFAGTTMWSCQGFSSFDYTRAGLSAAEQTEAGLAMEEGRLVVRGHIVTTLDPNTQSGYRHDFLASQAWVGGTSTLPTGKFARETDNGMVCIDDPCPFLDEHILNSTRTAEVSELDFGPSGASSSQQAEAWDAAGTADGVIVAGDRYVVHGVGGRGKGRTVTEYYVRLNP